MKSSVGLCIAITTLLLVAVAVMVFFNLRFDLIFYTVMAGQAMWIFTVYKVLRDNYSTDKNFDHWYEDHPVDGE